MRRQGVARWVIALMMSLSFPLGAMAQDSEVYKGGSFTIEPPAKWLLVSGNLSENEMKKLPANVREHYNQRNTDVLFMNIEGTDARPQGFKDSLNIVTVNEPIPLTEELVKELSAILKQQYTAMFEQFAVDSIGMRKLRDMDVLEVSGRYTILNYDVRLLQIFVPSKSESLILTCTFEATREESVRPLCLRAFESLVLK
ncbi:MAG: hypothetical protein FWC40_08515 [Proteobacteria bacterium]|nr:hypothetical protein [Pseudomonadota bacterium]